MTIGLSIGILLILIGFALTLMGDESQEEAASSDYYLTTTEQSCTMLQNLKMDKGSEDVSHLLDINALSFPKDAIFYSEDMEYKADPERDWIIELQVPQGHIFKKEELWAIFDYNWRDSFRSTVFGREIKTKRWTYVIAGDHPENYDQIEVAVSLLGVFGEEYPDYDPQKLERYLPALQQKFEAYPASVFISPKETVEMAIDRARHLVHLSQDINRDMVLILESSTQFDGRQAWDALTSLGLRWGDGDLFHWNNYAHHYGDDQFFSVSTSTEPGYFFPEEVQKGRMNPKNLIFSFSIHRNADPKGVFEIMLDCVKYCQKRLGGALLNQQGDALNEAEVRQDLHQFVQQIIDEGLQPGSEKALCL